MSRRVGQLARPPGGLGNRGGASEQRFEGLKLLAPLLNTWFYVRQRSADVVDSFSYCQEEWSQFISEASYKTPSATSLPVRRCNSSCSWVVVFYDCLDLIRADLYAPLADHKPQEFVSAYAKAHLEGFSFMRELIFVRCVPSSEIWIVCKGSAIGASLSVGTNNCYWSRAWLDSRRDASSWLVPASRAICHVRPKMTLKGDKSCTTENCTLRVTGPAWTGSTMSPKEVVDDPLNPDKIRPGFSRPSPISRDRMRASRCGCSVRVRSTGGKMIVPSMGRGPPPVSPGRMELILYNGFGVAGVLGAPELRFWEVSLPPVSERRYCFKCPALMSLSTKFGGICMFLLCGHVPCGRHISCYDLFWMGSVSRGLGHLKSDKPWIIGRSFSYDMERGVRGGLSGRLDPSCLRSDDLGRSGSLTLLSVPLLDVCPATRTCWVAARTSSSNIEYLFARLNKSSIVVGGFLASDSKNGSADVLLVSSGAQVLSHESFGQQRVVANIERHELSIMHDMVEWVAGPIVCGEFCQWVARLGGFSHLVAPLGASERSAPWGDHRVTVLEHVLYHGVTIGLGRVAQVVAAGGLGLPGSLESELSSRGARGMGVCGSCGLTLHASGMVPAVPGYIDSGSDLEFATWPLER
ncbi:hypothetical protein CK203_099234 [Vitis vinifera]|uniref:Uncharacterized protein n=1 Tax=Vitis vinifera TaxID=29760 RepID=A0A438CH17_VITVI|nr:hypothetical protein CK203_099234 [Vitis vinifera]